MPGHLSQSHAAKIVGMGVLLGVYEVHPALSPAEGQGKYRDTAGRLVLDKEGRLAAAVRIIGARIVPGKPIILLLLVHIIVRHHSRICQPTKNNYWKKPWDFN